jgi:hypothetical protein
VNRIAALALAVVVIPIAFWANRDDVVKRVTDSTSFVTPGGDEIGSRPSAAIAAAGMTTAAAGMTTTKAGMTTTAARPTSAAVPAPLPARPSNAAELPATLELVSVVPVKPGAALPDARPISRADALSSVIGSREFQETVSPLARLYFAAFGRFPDYAGLNYYTGVREDGAMLAQIADEFVRGREFEQRYGKLENAEFVERLFVNVVGYASQPDVRAYWVEELDSGRMTRGAVLVDLSESGAFRERTANQVFVSTAYTELLRRTPDITGYNHWVSLLDHGYPPRIVIDGLLSQR